MTTSAQTHVHAPHGGGKRKSDPAALCDVGEGETLTRVGKFFWVNTTDSSSRLFADRNVMLVLKHCVNSGLYDTTDQMQAFHERMARGGKQDGSARSKNRMLTNDSKRFPVLLYQPGVDGKPTVGNLNTFYASETTHFSKHGLDGFNRNAHQVGYTLEDADVIETDPPIVQQPVRVHAAGACQINMDCFSQRNQVDTCINTTQPHKRRRSKASSSSSSSSPSSPPPLLPPPPRTSDAGTTKKKRRGTRRSLTDPHAFVPVLRQPHQGMVIRIGV